ncbi:hypothetical protein ACO0LC_12415 [Undibacterium sp. JH2W]|uniref:hypothetical protein n=1 Tax=Undibacterium sp. JH2W TaxID=3413037 RepID=UPI003BF21FF2
MLLVLVRLWAWLFIHYQPDARDLNFPGWAAKVLALPFLGVILYPDVFYVRVKLE